MGDDLVSMRGWGHQKGNADGSVGGVSCATMSTLAWSCELIFDKQDRYLHLEAIAIMIEISY